MFFGFAKAPTFVCIEYRRDISVEYGIHNKISCSDCGLTYKDEMAFVRWLQVLDNENISLHEIDNTLESVTLRWQQTCRRPGYFRRSAECGLIPLGSVRRLVHIVKIDIAVLNLYEENPRKVK